MTPRKREAQTVAERFQPIEPVLTPVTELIGAMTQQTPDVVGAVKALKAIDDHAVKVIAQGIYSKSLAMRGCADRSACRLRKRKPILRHLALRHSNVLRRYRKTLSRTSRSSSIRKLLNRSPQCSSARWNSSNSRSRLAPTASSGPPSR